jgi:hypothetical protein
MYRDHDIEIMSRIIDTRTRGLSFAPWSDVDPLGGRSGGRMRSPRARRRSATDV